MKIKAADKYGDLYLIIEFVYAGYDSYAICIDRSNKLRKINIRDLTIRDKEYTI